MAAFFSTVALTPGDWTDLGVGPLQFQSDVFPGLTWTIADTKPGANDPALICPPDRVVTANTTSHVWVRANNPATTLKVTVIPFAAGQAIVSLSA